MKYLLVLVAVVAMASCKHEDYATPEERQRLEVTDDVIAAKESEAAQIEARILDLRADLKTAEDIAAAAAQFETLMVEYRAANHAIGEAVAEQREITRSIEDRTGGAALDMVLPFLPAPARAPFAVFATPLVGLFFKRTREHMANAAKNAAKLNLGEAIFDLTRAVGWNHTTDDPEQLAANAEALRLKAEAKAKAKPEVQP